VHMYINVTILGAHVSLRACALVHIHTCMFV